MWIAPLALMAVVVLIVLAIALLPYYVRKKRILWLQAFAKVIGFSFMEVADSAFMNKLRDFAPFVPKVVEWRFENMLVGTIDGVSIEIFDYSFTVDLRLFLQEDKRTRKQTIIHFESNKLHLPHFALRPKNILDRNHHRLGEAAFRIKGNQEFFQTYIIQTDDDTAVCALFDKEVCNHFARLLTKSVEGKGHQLIYYYEGHLISHERIDEFLDEAMQVFNLFAAKSKVQTVLKNSYHNMITTGKEIN